MSCVAFGFIQTRMTQLLRAAERVVDIGGRALRYGVQPDVLDTLAPDVPLGRIGATEDAAARR